MKSYLPLASVAAVLLTLSPTLAQVAMNCQGAMDVALVVDNVQSAGKFNAMYDAVDAFVESVRDNNPNVHMGLVYYSDIVNAELAVTNDYTQLMSTVPSSTGLGSRRTGTAINRAVQLLTGGRAGVAKTLVLVTDGSTDAGFTTERDGAVAAAVAAGVRILAVSVVQGVTNDLVAITRDRSLIQTTADFFQLSQTLRDLGTSLCAYAMCSDCVTEIGTRRAPHPTRCDKFFICEKWNDGTILAHEKSCRIGTLWHRKKVTCDHISNVLEDRANSGCETYCNSALQQGTRQYPVADYCEIFYQCTSDTTMAVSCCGDNQRFQPGTGCTSDVTCARRKYINNLSCRGYYFCDTSGLSPFYTTGCCPAATNYYDFTTGNCILDNDCRGTCETSVKRPCKSLFAHADACKFISRINTTDIIQDCPKGTAYDPNTCACDIVNASCPGPTQSCNNVGVETDFSATQPWGFQAGRHWLSVNSVTFSDRNMYLSGAGSSAVVNFFSNTDQVFRNDIFIRLSVLDDLGTANQEFVLLSNAPCPNYGYYSDAGTEASLFITMNPGLRTITMGVRTTDGDSTIQLNYSAFTGQDVWKEITLRYANPSLRIGGGVAGPLQGYLRLFSWSNSDVRTLIAALPISSSAVLAGPQAQGQILTSHCGLVLGDSRGGLSPFRGTIDDFYVYDSCNTTVPVVDFVTTLSG